MKETAIYIHIPFCDHKCIYCDFYSIISFDNLKPYLISLKKEINFFAEKFSSDRKIISIFFGGGTPSLMDAKYISEIIDEINKSYNVAPEAEVTLEANPGTISLNKLESFLNVGINRISIGIQSFDEGELKFLTRIHDRATAKQTVLDAKRVGFENISIDLIFNLPNQTKEIWQSNLQQAVELPIKHISTYSLIVEPGTILNKMVLDGKVNLQDDDYDAELYESTIEFFNRCGFHQYEVSNFALNGFECVHNKAYWEYKDYFGFGTSAHSFINGERWWNYSSLKFYNAAINKNGNAIIGNELLTKQQMLNEYIMLALRSKGLDLLELKNNFGSQWTDDNSILLNQLIEQDLLQQKNHFISLTPRGYALCDEILLKLKF